MLKIITETKNWEQEKNFQKNPADIRPIIDCNF